jgi:hypothetical protein
MLPTFVCGWDARALKARVAFGAPDQETLAPPETALERRYALRAVKQRLHQASFREAVITAYNGRCALSGRVEFGFFEGHVLDAERIHAVTEWRNEFFEFRNIIRAANRTRGIQDPRFERFSIIVPHAPSSYHRPSYIDSCFEQSHLRQRAPKENPAVEAGQVVRQINVIGGSVVLPNTSALA